MFISKDEISKEIAHQYEMIRALRERLRQRELQWARYGIDASPHIPNEITEINDDIRRRGEEIAHLKSVIAEDRFSLADVEYRALIAEGLDKGEGFLRLAVATRIEFTRVRLGIVPDHAKRLEEEVRRQLAEETLFQVGVDIQSVLAAAVKQASGEIDAERRAVIAKLREQLQSIALTESTEGGRRSLAKLSNKHIPDLYQNEKVKERIRTALDCLRIIREDVDLFPGVEPLSTIDGAKKFMKSNADAFLDTNQEHLSATLLVRYLVRSLSATVKQIRRAVRLHSQSTIEGFRAICTSQNDYDLFALLMRSAPWEYPGDQERIDQWLIALRQADSA